MNKFFIVILLIAIAVIYFINSTIKDNFIMIDPNIYLNTGFNEPIDKFRSKFIQPPYPTEPDVDYQAYLNSISGYNGASRSYVNPIYAQQIAAGLDT